MNINLKDEVSEIIFKKFLEKNILNKDKIEILRDYIILDGIDQLFFSFNCIDISKNLIDNSYTLEIKEDYSSIINTKIWDEFYKVSESVFNMNIRTFEKTFSQFYAEADANKISQSCKLYLTNNINENNLIDFFELVHNNDLSIETLEYNLKSFTNNYNIERLANLSKYLSKYIEILDYTVNYELIKTNKKIQKIDLFNLNFLNKIIENKIEIELKKEKVINDEVVEIKIGSYNNTYNSFVKTFFLENEKSIELFKYLVHNYDNPRKNSTEFTKYNHIYNLLKNENLIYVSKEMYTKVVKELFNFDITNGYIKNVESNYIKDSLKQKLDYFNSIK